MNMTGRRENIVIAVLVLALLGAIAYFVYLSQTLVEQHVLGVPRVAIGTRTAGETENLRKQTEIAKLAAEVHQIRSDTGGSLFWLKMLGLFVTVGGAVGGYLVGLTHTTQKKLDFEDRRNVDQVYQAMVQELADKAPLLRATAVVKLGSLLESFPAEWTVKAEGRGQLIKRTKQVLAAALAIEKDPKVRKTITIALPLHRPWARDPDPDRAKIADMRGLDLSSAKAADAYWARVDLSGADLYQADLERASFRKSVLSNTQFREARLRGAVFSDANCDQANFKMADLCGTDFAKAQALEKALFEEARYDDTTIFPPGFDVARHGLKRVEAN